MDKRRENCPKYPGGVQKKEQKKSNWYVYSCGIFIIYNQGWANNFFGWKGEAKLSCALKKRGKEGKIGKHGIFFTKFWST